MNDLLNEAHDINTAVFNNHVNDADNRARAIMRDFMPNWLQELEAVERDGNGIMHIFNVKATPATAAYAALVTAFVNENRKTKEPAPKYQHDCDRCVFLGRHVFGPPEESVVFDLYYHPADGAGRTVIARHGDREDDYLSGLIFGLNGTVPPLVEAVRRAEERGLDVEIPNE